MTQSRLVTALISAWMPAFGGGRAAGDGRGGAAGVGSAATAEPAVPPALAVLVGSPSFAGDLAIINNGAIADGFSRMSKLIGA